MSELRKILHVEDDPDIREIAKMALVDFGGFELLQCENGEVALAQAESFAPDVLLLDMMMPGMTGIETLAALREIEAFRNTPAIFMTAKDVATEYEEVLKQEAVGTIQKPFDPIALPDQIRAIAASSV